ncbi:MAG TPA: Gfo/Idh/MocA family oxidoreductase [Terriglobia bacterium]|nr:Gfo/Idh/MocA family oxidoreductase [Terriglobia bacterium]
MGQDSEISRREFLKSSAMTGAGLAAMGGLGLVGAPGRVLGANERVRVAVCGVRGRGFDHIRGFSRLPNVEVAAICDVDENVARKRMADMEKLGLAKPEYYVDVRKLLEDKSIDAISVATPDHWHSLIAIWGCQAGKDVYCEKPCCHNWWEGKQLVTAANRYNRMVQHGTQSRSEKGIIEAVQKMRDGLIGDVYLARGLCYKWRPTIGHTPNEPVPAGVHYDLWQGPAPAEPFTRNHFHYNWHYFWNYGSGDLGNQGIHQMDIARWGLGVKFPNKISAVGGKFLFKDDQLTPNTLNCTFQYDLPDGNRKMIEFEVRGWITNHEAGIGVGQGSHGIPAAGLQAQKHKLGPAVSPQNSVGDIFYGSKGYLAIDGGAGYKTWLGAGHEPGPHGTGGGDHFLNFIEAVRSRNKASLNAPIEEGYISSTLIYLANASYRLGKTIEFDPDTLRVLNDDEANRMLRSEDRGYRKPFFIPENV